MPINSFRVAVVLLSFLVSGCASFDSGSGAEVKTLGFLDDYGQLAPGKVGQASLIYIDGHTDFSAFDAIFVEPVVAWKGPDGEASASTRELATNLDEDLRRELALEFALVDRPRAGALRLRSALLSSSSSHVVLEVEILDAKSGARVVAAVDHRDVEAGAATTQTDAWAALIRDRLATFRQFDAATRAREAEEGGS